MLKRISGKVMLLLVCISISGFASLIAGCSQDTEVERTKLPYIDKPAEGIDASKAKTEGN